MRRHLNDLDGIQCPKGVRVSAPGVEVGEERVEFARGAVGVRGFGGEGERAAGGGGVAEGGHVGGF